VFVLVINSLIIRLSGQSRAAGGGVIVVRRYQTVFDIRLRSH